MSSGIHVRVRVGREAYALPVERVIEVGELRGIAPVPGAARSVLGVCNLRGDVLPVVDLAAVLDVPGEARPARVVVAQRGAALVGLAVDSVSDVGPLPGAVEDVESSLLSGCVLADGDLVGLLDVDRLFAVLEGAR